MEGSRFQQALMSLGNRLLATDMETGALPTVYAATAPDLPGGTFVGPTSLFQTRGGPGPVASSARAKDPETARRLWEVSEQLTGVQYDFAAAATG